MCASESRDNDAEARSERCRFRPLKSTCRDRSEHRERLHSTNVAKAHDVEVMHKLLTPQVARLGRPDVPPETDAVAPSFSEGTPESLKADLIELLGETQVLNKAIDLVRFASDASPYRYIPQVV